MGVRGAAIASIASNALRVPVVHLLAGTSLGLNGVWWGITLTASLRGIWVFLWFLKYARTRPKQDAGKRDSVRNTVSGEIPSVRLLP